MIVLRPSSDVAVIELSAALSAALAGVAVHDDAVATRLLSTQNTNTATQRPDHPYIAFDATAWTPPGSG